MTTHFPVPPFTRETAVQKVRLAEDAWNSRNPEKVALAYTQESRWRNRAEFVNGRQEIASFLTRKWTRELDYRLIKELWAFTDNRIAVRFAYEWHDDSGNWFRSHGNENWEFDESGLMRLRLACINDLPISESERKYHWPIGRRPNDYPGLSDLGLYTPGVAAKAESEALDKQVRALTDSTLNRRRLIKMGNLPAIAHDSNPRCDAIFSFSLLRVRFYLNFSTLFRPFSSLRIVHPKRQERTVLRFHSSRFS